MGRRQAEPPHHMTIARGVGAGRPQSPVVALSRPCRTFKFFETATLFDRLINVSAAQGELSLHQPSVSFSFTASKAELYLRSLLVVPVPPRGRPPNAAAQTRIVSGGEFWPSRQKLSRHLDHIASASQACEAMLNPCWTTRVEKVGLQPYSVASAMSARARTAARVVGKTGMLAPSRLAVQRGRASPP
jgi:hypothetical protein